MSSSSAITFGNLQGKLDVLRVACRKCRRTRHYRVDNLIARCGADTKLPDWIVEVSADCPRRTKDRVALSNLCGVYLPDLVKISL
jgi:hypothetical protein